MVVEPGGRKCGCGAKGCVEAYASATGLKGMLAEALAKGTETTLSAGSEAPDMARAAQAGDALARELFERAGRNAGPGGEQPGAGPGPGSFYHGRRGVPGLALDGKGGPG